MPILSKIFSGGFGSLSRRKTSTRIIGVFYQEFGGYYAGRISYQPEGYSTMLLGGDVYDLYVAQKSGGEATGKQYKTTASCDGIHNTSSTTAPNSQYDGYYNTYTSVLGVSSSHPAANFCRDLVLNGFSDWYLPTEREAIIAYANLKNIGRWVSGDEAFQSVYWLSFGDSCSNAGVLTSASKWWPQYGLVGGYPKTDSAAVRAIRRVYVGREGSFSATGGVVSTPGDGYKYHIFESPGTFSVAGYQGGQIEVAMVGSGGNGGTPCGDNGPSSGQQDSGGAGGGGGAFAEFLFNVQGQITGQPTNYPITVSGGAGGPTRFTSPAGYIDAGGGPPGPGSCYGDVPGVPGGSVTNLNGLPIIRSTAGTGGGGTRGADQAGDGGSAGHVSARSGQWWIDFMGSGTGGTGNLPAGTPGPPGLNYGGGGAGGAGQGGDRVPGIGQGGAGAAGRLVIRYPQAPSSVVNRGSGGDSVSYYPSGSDTYAVHVFTNPGTFEMSSIGDVNIDYLVIGGGGPGGTDWGGNGQSGGGGGAGALVEGSSSFRPGSIFLTIGDGGTGGGTGGQTIWGNSGGVNGYIVSGGGGAGGSSPTASGSAGVTGGSGGGGAGGPVHAEPYPGGNAGGSATIEPALFGTTYNGSGGSGGEPGGDGSYLYVGGGGGGAGSPGGRGLAGAGRVSTITGSPATYAAGGPNSNSANPGYGFGGGGNNPGNRGAVIIRYNTGASGLVPGLYMNSAPPAIGGGGLVNVTNFGPFTFTSTSSFTAIGGNYQVTMKMRGGRGGFGNNPNYVTYQGHGGYVRATVPMVSGESYNAYVDPSGAWSGLFYGANATSAPVCIMLAAQGGGGDWDGAGSYQGYATGGHAGASGNSGTGWVVTAGAGGGGGGGGTTTTGYLTGSGGSGGSGAGPEGPTANGTPGGLFSAGLGGPGGTSAEGQNGGFGYFGGGGGGGYKGQLGGGGGAGGGGSNYVGGLPPSAPYPVPVTNTQNGTENGGVLVEIISITPY